jgi:hypothetical protein
MAIVQISKIIHRVGLIEELPQLDTGEIGFASDENRVFIGNDLTLYPQTGPEPSLTEIVTKDANCKISTSQLEGSINYTPSTTSDWSGTPPTTIGEAIDRLAAVVKVLNSGTGA